MKPIGAKHCRHRSLSPDHHHGYRKTRRVFCRRQKRGNEEGVGVVGELRRRQRGVGRLEPTTASSWRRRWSHRRRKQVGGGVNYHRTPAGTHLR
ncbi:hypothetical protein Hanom_Chr12g01179181 [Helianthus anomalus]